jgi:oligosaccharyltransferase complex subunit beta
MLDPYVRQPMPLKMATAKEAKYSVLVQIPDVYGVFTFTCDYKKPGYSYIEHNQLVSIRPFRHDEYPRYIPSAYPYYTTTFSHMVAFAMFSLLWLSHRANWGQETKVKESNLFEKDEAIPAAALNEKKSAATPEKPKKSKENSQETQEGPELRNRSKKSGKRN